MAQNLEMDPEKKDYVVVRGSPVATDRVLEPSYFTLLIPRDRWVNGNPGEGSYLWRLQNVKRTSDTEQQFSTIVTEALQAQIISTGRASAAAVKNVAATRTGSSNSIGVVPAQTQVSEQLDFVPV